MRLSFYTSAAGDEGASAVEFAFIAPVLFLLVLGVMQFGLIFTQLLQVEHGAAEGVRYAALRYTGTEVTQRVRDAAPLVDLSGSGAVSVTPADPSGPGVAQNTEATVVVTSQVPVILPFFASALDGDGDGRYDVTATARQRIE